MNKLDLLRLSELEDEEAIDERDFEDINNLTVSVNSEIKQNIKEEKDKKANKNKSQKLNNSKDFEDKYFSYYDDIKQPKKYIFEDW